jgi:DNA-binding GntR family transcriptional regulator
VTDNRARGPREVANDIAGQVHSGRLTAGSKLPTYFALAETYHVSVSTVQRAIALLNACGLTRGQRGSGVYIAESAGRMS